MIEIGAATARVLADVHAERIRQEQIGESKRASGIDWRSCADPAMAGGDDKRAAVLGEEFGEVCRAVLEAGYAMPMPAALVGILTEGDEHLREELVQVAAVAVAWAEAIDART